jgi:hypothetical protein
MTKRHFGDWIKAFVNTFDAKTEAPARLLFWTAVATIGGAVTRRAYIDEVIFKLYPNFYIVFVAPPGALTKSTTISFGINILRELDHVFLAADNTTYPAFIKDLSQRYVELRTTLGDDIEDDQWIKQCAVTAGISELGTFFKPEDEEMVNGLTDLWDCRPLIIKDTKYGGTDVLEHPFFNLIAGTTTKWIKDKIKSQLGGWGLSSRIIFVYESKKTKFVARPSRLWSAGEFERLSHRLVEDLKWISDLEGPITFSPAADALVTSWYEAHSRKMAAHADLPDADPWLGYFFARKQAHIHKLAMVLSLSRRDTLVIEKVDYVDAMTAVDAVEVEVPYIFKHAPEPTALALLEHDALEKIGKLLAASPAGMIPRMSAFAAVARTVDSATANRILDAAIGRGDLRQRVDKGKTYLLP